MQIMKIDLKNLPRLSITITTQDETIAENTSEHISKKLIKNLMIAQKTTISGN